MLAKGESGGVVGHISSEREFSILAQLTELNPKVPSDHRLGIVRKALYSCINSEDVTLAAYKTALNKGCSDYLKKKLIRFVAVTSISVQHTYFDTSNFFGRRRLNGVTIDFSKEFPKGVRKAQLKEEVASLGFPEDPAGYTCVTLTVNARSADEAVEKGLRSLNILRGLWNYSLNFGNVFPRYGSYHRPYNAIVGGHIIAVFEAEGMRKVEGVWTHGASFSLLPSPLSSIRFEKLRASEKRGRSQLKKSPFREQIEDWIVELCEALDLPSHSDQLLGQWRLLERMIGADASSSHDEVVKRVSAIFIDRDYHRVALNALRKTRNSLVHEKSDSSHELLGSVQLRYYVEQVLAYFVNNYGGAESLKEARDILKLTQSRDELARDLRVRRKAHQYLKMRLGASYATGE